MTAFVIFWSATFAIVFFLLGVFFKALASAFNALLSSLGEIIAIDALAGLAELVLYLLYAIIDGIIKQGFWSVVGTIIMFVIMLGLIGALMGGLGAIILEIVVSLAESILSVTSRVLEWAARFSENLYIKNLKAIISRLDKC